MASKKEGGHSCPLDELKTGTGKSPLQNPRSSGCVSQDRSHNFVNPYAQIDVTNNRLPHWQQGSSWVFVTWRLHDSIPKQKLVQWMATRERWLQQHLTPWDEQTAAEYHQRFAQQIDDWLDQGIGSCVLKNSVNARIVADSLRHFDGERYEMGTFVVMPNHVHVLFRPLGGHLLSNIVKSWKGFSARKINALTGESGAVWQADYWDQLIRNDLHYHTVVTYIRENPAKAQLSRGEYLLG